MASPTAAGGTPPNTSAEGAQPLTRRPILRNPSVSSNLCDEGGYNDGAQQQVSGAKKRTSFSRNDPERFEFAPGLPVAPGGKGKEIALPHHRRKPHRSSFRSSGSAISIERSSVEESLASTASTWSRAQRLLCCQDPSKQHGPVATFLIGLVCCPCQPPQKVLDVMRSILDSWGYGIPFLFFTFVLLFGAPIQNLWCPKTSDKFFDGVFIAAFAFFVADSAMRCYVSPPYFTFEVCGKDWRHDAGPGRRPRLSQGGMKSGWGGLCIKIGSFMFWCDVVSTISLLYDITWLNEDLSTKLKSSIELDEYGIPDVSTSAMLSREYVPFIVVIGRSARIARFIQATAIAKTSENIINWIWVSRIFDLAYWFRVCFCRGPSNSKGGTILEDLAAAETASSPMRRKSSFSTRKGGISLSAVTAAAQDENDDCGVFKSMVGFLTCVSCRDKAQVKKRENNAAKMIQRAWRISTNGKMMSQQLSASDVTNSGKLGRSSFLIAMRRGKSSSSSALSSSSGRRKQESQVGSAMRELTGQRVAFGIMLTILVTAVFTVSVKDSTAVNTMVLLHSQTQINGKFKNLAIDAARRTVIPNLYEYQDANGNSTEYLDSVDPSTLREREIWDIFVTDSSGNSTMGEFSIKEDTESRALVQLIATILIIFIWMFGVAAFSGPVMTLVVTPIERMVRLLTMLMKDPLGYQSTPRYKRFVAEEDDFLKHTRWRKDVLKGMETSFLMSTILRIGSLMKVGFGSAGVEIIRQNLDQGKKKNGLFLNSKGSTVSCIFLFCDIRQFTDATESLQEEVFVFTNKIAAVVHSICNSYGGSANKNIGDAFLMSWLLDDESKKGKNSRVGNSFMDSFGGGGGFMGGGGNFEGSSELSSGQNQADKALLSVVKICIALYNDKFYVESMSEDARARLLAKIAKRQGPVVQMGFGLHAGKAVQGAIGSERKLDATYLSEAVERSEFLESSTKKYGLKMLMSNAFHDLLEPNVRRRCRKVDQLILRNEDDVDEDADILETGEVMELYTYDMDVEAMWKENASTASVGGSERGDSLSDDGSQSGSFTGSSQGTNMLQSSLPPNIGSRREVMRFAGAISGRNLTESRGKGMRRRVSLMMSVKSSKSSSDNLNSGSTHGVNQAKASSQALQFDYGELNERGVPKNMPQLVLPSGTAMYRASVWNASDMRVIRKRYSDGLFFQKFNSGLQSFYARDWEHARQCFRTILERFEDGPSRYFLNQIEENIGVPPRNWIGYGLE